jgi:hypothetical protein
MAWSRSIDYQVRPLIRHYTLEKTDGWAVERYEWKEIQQMCSRAVALAHFTITVTMRCDWMRHRHENNGKPFQCYGMSYRVRAVSQCCTFPTHTKTVPFKIRYIFFRICRESLAYYLSLESSSHREAWSSLLLLFLNRILRLQDQRVSHFIKHPQSPSP